VVGAGFILHD